MNDSPASGGNQNPREASLRSLLAGKHACVVDGAWGTEFYARGLPRDEISEVWNLSHPDIVQDVAARYVAEGVTWVGTNSFNGNPLRLAAHGLGGAAHEINCAAAAASRCAAGERGLVLGTMGPTGAILQDPHFPEERLAAACVMQAEALLEGGADGLLLETLMDAREAAVALHNVAPLAPVVCCFTFLELRPGLFQTLIGQSVNEVIAAACDAGASVVGANCTLDPGGMSRLAPQLLRAAGNVPVLLRPNAGQPVEVYGKLAYPLGTTAFATFARDMQDLGAAFIGGCCGTTPATIRAMVKALGDG